MPSPGSNTLTQTLADLPVYDHAQPIGELAAAVHAGSLREEVNFAWMMPSRSPIR
jgi:hypothetical protein